MRPMQSILLATLNFALATPVSKAAEAVQPPIDRGALMCFYGIVAELTGLQKRCHPEDQEFSEKLDEPIHKMEQFFVASRWADEKTIKLWHAGFDKIAEDMKLHPIHTIAGDISDVCKEPDIEQLYQKAHKSEDDYRRRAINLIAKPPLMTNPHGSPCF